MVLDPVPDGHLDALMAHAYLYVLPSLADDTSDFLLRALAHGRAAVVSDLPGHLDVAGGDAFTFTGNDVDDLWRVMGWLLADPAAVDHMERRAAAAAASRYCWDRIAEAYELVFSSVL
jgi:glycosyltransferase involved in cell wall biosynthesis